MGFAANVGQKVREFFAREPEAVAAAVAKGAEVRLDPEMGMASSQFGGSYLDAYGWDGLRDQLAVNQGLMDRYVDYEQMEDYPEIATCYDIYADDATQPDFLSGRTAWVTSKDQRVEKIGNELFHKTLQIENDIWALVRALCKYGNVFGENLVTPQGVIGQNFLPAPTVRRIESKRGVLLGFVQDTSGQFNISSADFASLLRESETGGLATAVRQGGGEVTAYEDWEVTHWRLSSKHLRSIYGFGIGEPARWIWKRLMLLEDALLIFKLTRAPSRYAFYIDTGGLDQQRGLAYVQQVAQKLKRKKFIDPVSGRPNLRYNPLAYDEDFFIPTKEGRESSRVEVLNGPDYQGTEDVEYFLSKLYSALKVPRSYLNQMESVSKAVLSQEDVQFARTIMRIQREVVNGLRKTFRVHLSALGIAPSTVEYEINMTVPSSIFELARMEVWSARADLMTRLQDAVPMSWILQNIFHFSEGEAVELMKEKDGEMIHRAEVDATAGAETMRIQSAAEAAYGGMEAEEVRRMVDPVAAFGGSFERMMTEGKGQDHFKKLDDKFVRMLKEQKDLREQIAKTNLFLQEIRHGLRYRRAA